MIVIALHDLYLDTNPFNYIYNNEFKLNFPKIRYRERILHAKVLVGP